MCVCVCRCGCIKTPWTHLSLHGLLLIFALQSDGLNDLLEAYSWTPGVLVHLVLSLNTHTAQKSRWSRLFMSRTLTLARCRGPPRIRESAPECTCATPQPDTRVCDRSYGHVSRTQTVPDYISHQLVTGRRYTRLTATFCRQVESRFEPRTRA